MPDRLHPSSIGAGRIAQKLYEYLKPENYDPNPCTLRYVEMNIEAEPGGKRVPIGMLFQKKYLK